jgi:hypothetical protein
LSLFANNALDSHPFLLENKNLADAAYGAYTIRPRTVGVTGVYRW